MDSKLQPSLLARQRRPRRRHPRKPPLVEKSWGLELSSDRMPIHAAQKLKMFLVFGGVLASIPLWLSGSFAQSTPLTNPPTFYRDVLPILERHCHSYHRT